VGLWPEQTFPAREAVVTAPLPTLQTLAVGQIAFILLIHPLVIMARRGPGGGGPGRFIVPAEAGLCLLMTVPFYVAAAFLADATAADVVRAAIYVACVWSVVWAASAHLASRAAGGTLVVGMLVLAAIGLPSASYIAGDFMDAPAAAKWLWQASPATFAWQAATPRAGSVAASGAGSLGSCLPGPLWAAICWPALAGAACLARVVLTGSPKPK